MKKKSMELKPRKFSMKKENVLPLTPQEQAGVAGGVAVRSYTVPCNSIKKCVLD